MSQIMVTLYIEPQTAPTIFAKALRRGAAKVTKVGLIVS
jgi:hypothetical protein